MYWQIIEKACFTEYQDCQCPSAGESPVLRSIPVAVYRYYLLRHENSCMAVLEQEHWGGDCISFYTSRIPMQEGLGVYLKMVSCGKNPENIQNMGIQGTPYEGSLDINESDFGLVLFSEEDLDEESPSSEKAPETTGGYRPDTHEGEAWPPQFMRSRPEYDAIPKAATSVVPVGLPGISAQQAPQAPPTPKNPYAFMPPNINTSGPPHAAPHSVPQPSENYEEDPDVGNLPDLPPLPSPAARERNPLDFVASPRRPAPVPEEGYSSYGDGPYGDSYDDDDDDDDDGDEY